VLKSGTKVFGSGKKGEKGEAKTKMKSVGEMLFDQLDFDQSGLCCTARVVDRKN
jgi:hypothetical protein